MSEVVEPEFGHADRLASLPPGTLDRVEAYALAAIAVTFLTRDGSGVTAYYGGLRWRVRDRETGDYVYEVTTSLGGLDAHEARASISRDLDSMTVHDFERAYGIDRRWDR